MAGDNLRAILGMIRAEIPGVPDETWSQIERALRGEFGGQRAYIAEHKKRSHLEALAAADQAASNADLARKLGLSVSRIKQLKRLR
jgi:hypothetical protein